MKSEYTIANLELMKNLHISGARSATMINLHELDTASDDILGCKLQSAAY